MSETRRDSGFGIRDSGTGMPVDLDAAIDAVAREMTDAEPSGALRAHVLEQIRPDRRRSAAVPRWAWAGATAAVVLAAATAIWVISPMRGPEDAPTTVAQQRSGTPSPAVAGDGRVVRPSDAGPGDASAAAALTASVPKAGRAAAARSAAPGAALADEGLHQVQALAEIEPLRFATVGPDPLQIAAVEVTAFPAMTPIDIPSLDAGSSDITSADPKKENRP